MRASRLPDYLSALRRYLAGDIRTDRYSRVLYSTDASIYRVEPLAVVIPRAIEDVHVAVELAAEFEVPLLPRTSGSSLAGQAVNEAVVIDMTRHLDRVLDLDVEARRVRVQPGLVLDDLNQQLRPHGLQFGPDPASSNRAAMGGIVSNNSTGSHSIRYGMTADHVLETNVILSDGSTAGFGPLDVEQLEQRRHRTGFEGEIYRELSDLVSRPRNQAIIRQGTPRHWRRCGGYNLDRFVDQGVSFKVPSDPNFNLSKLVCGAEGTLAVMTDVTLGLVPLPAFTGLALIHFDDLHRALSAVPVILETDPDAIELLDNLGLTLCREVPEYARLLETFIDGSPNCLLVTEFSGSSEKEIRARIQELERTLQRASVGATALVPVEDPAVQQDVWTVRKVGLGLLMSIPGDHKPIPFIEDAAVPVGHLAEYVIQVERFCNDLGTRVAYYAHASAGCVHIRPLVDTKTASEIAKLPDILGFSVELLHGYGGALSSEHGDGRARSWINQRFFGPELYGLYRDVKQAFDPRGLLNPGNIVDGPEMTDNLRFGDEYQTRSLDTHIDFESDFGFDRAVEMCNGAGVCRKLTTGTMCPSFMVTREEEHSTRGRANLLRAAISGDLSAAELTSDRLHQAMDLCVECKACKAECPSSVDMAKIKIEFLAMRNDARGIPLRSQLFGQIGELGRLAAGPGAPLLNGLLGAGPTRWLLQTALGISSRRSLPRFARESFSDWFARRTVRDEGDAGEVVLFVDTFNNYQAPQVARAATEVCEQAGFQVTLSDHGCCGRPMISKGLLEEARLAARQTIARLAPLAEQGLPIIGLEPSCLLSLRDEYFYLLPGDSRVGLVAEQALTFEEWVSQRADQDGLDLHFTDSARQLLLHGHCHQKALVGSRPSHRALSLPGGYEVNEVDSGCCGMAGSFGYEHEHYELSMQMAERRLLPAVRDAAEDTLLVAAGTSCRQQIEHGCGRRALHPAEVLADALAGS